MYCEKFIEKLQDEHKHYKEWLLVQSPDEILDHAHEYSVRERILGCLTNDLVEYVLTEEQAKALLDVPNPFEVIYVVFSHYDDMDEILESIELIANEKLNNSIGNE